MPFRSEKEEWFVLPQHKLGLDVIALIGRLHHAVHRRVPEIHGELVRRCVPISSLSVGNFSNRYNELLTLSTLEVGLSGGDGRSGPSHPAPRRPPAQCQPRGTLIRLSD